MSTELVPAFSTTPPATTPAPAALRLDLACGQVPRQGFEGVDLWEGAKHVVDLQKFPWPFETNSVVEVFCSHYVEHIPHHPKIVTADGKEQNPFFAFFDELHRIMEGGAWARIIVPCARSNRAFWDPTHERFIMAETFLYLSSQWRRDNGLSHYNTTCDFNVNVLNAIADSQINTYAPEVAQRHLNNYWNTINDFHALLQCVKPGADLSKPAPQL